MSVILFLISPQFSFVLLISEAILYLHIYAYIAFIFFCPSQTTS